MFQLTRSGRRDKVFRITGEGVDLHFGTKRAFLFTTDARDKERWLALHKHRDWDARDDVVNAAFWSRWLLNHSTSLDENIAEIRRRFGFIVIR